MAHDTALQQHIAFWRVRYPETCGPCDREVYVMDAVDSDNDGNGDNQTNLTNDPAVDYQPDWPPDGTQISFISNREDDEYSLWTVPAPQPASSPDPWRCPAGRLLCQPSLRPGGDERPDPCGQLERRLQLRLGAEHASQDLE